MDSEEVRCWCRHRKDQHALGTNDCDNCACRAFRLAVSLTDNVLEESGLKDSGQRLQFDSGMVRDVVDDKPGYHFMIPKNVPMYKQMLTRVAEHLRKGAMKYSPRNWEKGDSEEEVERARESAFRHMMQWMMDEVDEDHAAAVIVNIIFAETMQYKVDLKKRGLSGSTHSG